MGGKRTLVVDDDALVLLQHLGHTCTVRGQSQDAPLFAKPQTPKKLRRS
jgi:hypothetical protein